MSKIKAFISSEAVLILSALLAVGSMFAVPPDKLYAHYINYSVLILLFCLMAAVAGLQAAGVFSRIADSVSRSGLGKKGKSLLLILICFFSSALITNDVALITFVPFTIGLLGCGDKRTLIAVIVLETVSANLGSVITPIGNPQNLFIYSQYAVPFSDFMRVVLPLGIISLALILICWLLLVPKVPASDEKNENDTPLHTFQIVRCTVIFILSILSVLGILDHIITLAATLVILLIFDRRLFGKIDYSLLLTFVCFFVFVGNLARIEAVEGFISSIVSGRELLTGALASQIISNVPAAAMLASFTENWQELLLGVNIGGLGTPIASMASLISMRLYNSSENASKGRYLLVFSAVNFILLIILLAIYIFVL